MNSTRKFLFWGAVVEMVLQYATVVGRKKKFVKSRPLPPEGGFLAWRHFCLVGKLKELI